MVHVNACFLTPKRQIRQIAYAMQAATPMYMGTKIPHRYAVRAVASAYASGNSLKWGKSIRGGVTSVKIADVVSIADSAALRSLFAAQKALAGCLHQPGFSIQM